MENLLEQKSEKSLRGWLIAGAAAGFLYLAASVGFIIQFGQTVAGAYDAVSVFVSVIGAYADTFGLISILSLIFFMGLLLKKGSADSFVGFMNWALLLLSLYYIMPKFTYFYQVVYYSSTIDLSQTVYILSSVIPHIIFSAFMVTYLYQIKSGNRKVPYVLSWISFLGAVVGFACQAVFVVQRITGGDTALNIFYYAMSALSLLVLVFTSMVYHKASQKQKGEFYGF